uniref:Uncharacterized protein n=1 Tax=Romanomermis culicivorax TaxID=13658 RepID=A0A915J569_ROMCU
MKRGLDRFGFTISGGCPDPKIPAVDNSIQDPYRKKKMGTTIWLRNAVHYENDERESREAVSMNGSFRKACILFDKREGGIGNQALETLISVPCQKYDRLLGSDGYLTTHDSPDYHKMALIQMIEFEQRIEKPEAFVVNILNKKRAELIQKNREFLVPIVKSVVFLGQCGLVTLTVSKSLQSTDNDLIGVMSQISQESLGRQSVCLDYHDDKKHWTHPP